MQPFNSWLNSRANEVALVVAILVVVAVTIFADSSQSYLHDPATSAEDILRNAAMLTIFALGASVVIIAGGIDLSAGSMIAFSGTTIACTMLWIQSFGTFEVPVAEWKVVSGGIAAGLFAGFLVGTLHAWLITSVGLPPFVATLATLVGLRSLARVMGETVTQSLLSGKKSQIPIEQPFFTDFLRQRVDLWIYTALGLAILTVILLGYTILGRHLYALGGNEQAARLSGLRTDRLKWFAYVFGAMTASLASIFYLANEGVSAPVTQARGHELNAIAAAVVGGCSLKGGVGTVAGTLLGALFLRVVIDAVAKIIKSGADVWEGLIVGVVVVLAVTFSQLRSARGSGRTLLGGALGVCAIAILSVASAAVIGINLGTRPGIIVGIVMAVALTVVRWLENRRRLAV
jgi:ribose/xylose/arabinose/galactoside ABC-type transport system permease subunit